MPYLPGHLLSSHFCQTLFWTFVHSFWQSALLTLFAGFIVLSTQRSRPDTRYRLLGLLFLVFIAGSGFTFYYLWGTGRYAGPMAESPITALSSFRARPGSGGPWAVLHTYSPFLLGIWFFIFLVKAIRISSGFRALFRTDNLGIRAPQPKWAERFDALTERLAINREIRFFESATLKVPATFGFIKPIVLVPLGLLGQLPPEQVETILLHELAHIKRKDFLAHSVQKAIEAVFFFNPFVLWVSKLIHEERENCCDQMVLDQTKDKATMLRALIHFEESRGRSLYLAQHFSGQKGALLNRARRIATERNKSLNDLEKVFVILSFLLCTGLCFSLVRPPRAVDPYATVIDNKAIATKEERKQVVVQGIVIESINLSSRQDTLKVAHAITKDLIESGIIRSEKALSYKLDDKELIVNGIRQSMALHLKLKKKYVCERGWSVLYNLYGQEYYQEPASNTIG